jgi:RNA polymerase sigma-70 factor (ECF subfamily)
MSVSEERALGFGDSCPCRGGIFALLSENAREELMLDHQARTDSFTVFVKELEPRLRHALIPSIGLDGANEATAEALAYGWEHWDRLREMENPSGYLYRVARSSVRKMRRRGPGLPPAPRQELPQVEPGLPKALARLSEKQRTVVWLVHGLEWKQTEVAELLGVSADTVNTHLSRGMKKLRAVLGTNR